MIPDFIKTINRHTPRWLPTVLITAAILYLTLAPHPIDTNDMPLFEGADKLVHAIMFGAFAVVLLYDWNRHRASAPRTSLVLASGALAIVFGAAIEWMQAHLTTARSGDAWDLLADAVGVVAALVICRGIWRHQRAVRRPACRD